MAVDKALEGHDAADKSVMPLSQINITGGDIYQNFPHNHGQFPKLPSQ
ncbi:hypothetical protein PR003_g34406 [Phytophthora rubi]|uniref:Uncharacterized protein n=1 Tax=Phytophthora rubi TaxID=129364 RepID=A0A6A4ARG4_9STRA|nr:hypothetical protein PR001_g33292 [Phytophthora rubi]KAE9260358.1 hypothetical protein PR003_g34406 [Phytophthora rubi]